MRSVLEKDTVKFFFGFVGVLSLGLVSLIAIGFYQVEVLGERNLSAIGASVEFPIEYP